MAASYAYTAPSHPHPQGQVTAQILPAIDIVHQQMNTPPIATPYHFNTNKDATQIYSWAQDNLVFVFRDGQRTSNGRRTIRSAVHNKGLVALNNLPLPQSAMDLIRMLRQMKCDTKEVRRTVLNRFLQFVGTAKAIWTYNPSEGGHIGQNLRAIKIRGISQVPLHYGELSYGDRVSVVSPVLEEYSSGDFFGRQAGRRMEHGKLMMCVRKVDPYDTCRIMRSLTRAYFKGESTLNTLIQQTSEHDRHLLAPFVLPEYLKRLLKMAMILGQYLGIASGVFTTRAPNSTSRGGTSYFESALSDSTVADAGYAAFNYSDALHYVIDATTGSKRMPSSTTDVNTISTLGSDRLTQGTHNEDLRHAMDYTIAALQLANITTSHPTPASSGGGRPYASEGMYAEFASRDQRNVIERSTTAFNNLLSRGCQMLAANMASGQERVDLTLGYDPNTQRNDGLFRIGTDVSLNTRRDAGAAANAVMQALPTYLNVAADAAHDFATSHGTVVGPGRAGGVVNIYFG